MTKKKATASDAEIYIVQGGRYNGQSTAPFALNRAKDYGAHFQVAIIYDSSYLMNDPPVWSLNRTCRLEEEMIDWYTDDEGEEHGFEGSEKCQATEWSWSFHHFVANEVKEEIAQNYKDDDKKKAAANARKVLARLMKVDSYKPVQLSEITAPQEIDGILGADSKVDQLLIAYCLDLEKSGEYDLVYLATDDGGIQIDIATLQETQRSTIQILSTDRRMVKLPSDEHSLALMEDAEDLAEWTPWMRDRDIHIWCRIKEDCLMLMPLDSELAGIKPEGNRNPFDYKDQRETEEGNAWYVDPISWYRDVDFDVPER